LSVRNWQSRVSIYLIALTVWVSSGCRAGDTAARTGVGMPARLVSMPLTDQDGQAREVTDFDGKILVFNFFFTSCASICPRETKALAEVQQRLPAQLRPRVRFVSLSVDPEVDTPEALKKFALAHHADLTGWSFVRANPTETRALITEMAAFDPRTEGGAAVPEGHSTSVYLFDGGRQLKQRYAGSPLDVPRLAREIEQLDAWLQKQSGAS
jgi:protein SCO1